MRHATAIAAIGLLAADACRSVDAPALDGSRAFAPSGAYQLWWSLTESCSGRTGDGARVHWMDVPGTEWLSLGGVEVDGLWIAAGNRVVLAGSERLDAPLVRHEMLHALLRSPRHLRAQFLGRCAGVVACVGQCITDAGRPTQDSTALVVPPDSLEVGIRVAPEIPGRALYDGAFAIVATVRNPSARPLAVDLGPSGDAGAAITYSIEVIGIGTSASTSPAAIRWDGRLVDAQETWFSPGEIKQHVFDVAVAGSGAAGADLWTLPPGVWTVRVAYGGRWTPLMPLTVAP